MVPFNPISDPKAFAEEMNKAYETFKTDNEHRKGNTVSDTMDIAFRDLINDTQFNPAPQQSHGAGSIRARFIDRMLPLIAQNNWNKNPAQRVLLPLELIPSVDLNV